jgi:hypothetical protein
MIPLLLPVAAASACGGGGDDSAATFNCKSKCPNDPFPFAQATFCQGMIAGPCAGAIATFEQCLSVKSAPSSSDRAST